MAGQKVVTKGDLNEMKAPIITGVSEDVLVNGKKVATKSKSMVKDHPKPGKGKHPKNEITKGSDTVLVNGMKMAFKGVPDKCKHKMVKVSCQDVLCDGTMG
jgi:uncharacterized Zn-binding protein involved in type VI secretion